MKFQTINPATEEVLAEYDIASETEVNEKVKKARATFAKWKETPFSERSSLLLKFASTIRKRKQEIGETMTKEMGKTIKESVAEVEKCAWVMEYYAENTEKFLKPEEIKTEAISSKITFQPLGVVGSIMPWNFPIWQVLRFGIPAIAAGNCMVFKPASVVPATGLATEKAALDSGFENGVLQTVIGDSSTGRALINSQTDSISVTGSVFTGSKVMTEAAKHPKKVVLELGGSDPFIVLKDANIEKAAKAASAGRFLNCGQSCIAAKRFIVEESIAKNFTEKFVEATASLKVGNPLDKNTDIGPMVSRQAREELEKQLKATIAKGGKLKLGGNKISGKGYFFEPTIVTDVKPGMSLFDEESFGPVAPVITAKNPNDAIALANNSEFGLGASLWSEDREKAEKLAAKIEAGMVSINTTVKSDPRLPFGGIKKSGIGRELSRYGLLEFVNIKSVVVY